MKETLYLFPLMFGHYVLLRLIILQGASMFATVNPHHQTEVTFGPCLASTPLY